VIALASIAITTGVQNPWLVLVVAAAGSWVGDNIAFSIGRHMRPDRLRWLRRPGFARLMGRGRSALDRRPASVILTARFIPVGRIAINVVAGTSGFPRHRFLLLSALSGTAWSVYSVLIGILAGAWIRDQAILGAGMGIAIAVALGFSIDFVSRRLEMRRCEFSDIPRGVHLRTDSRVDNLVGQGETLTTPVNVDERI
jgi:membrane-associated protein